MPGPRRTLFRAIALAAAAAASTACTGFAPPRPATLARLRPLRADPVPARFEVEIESPALTGVFDAVFAPQPHGFALQLFPDIGAKVLDLTVAGGAVAADTPAGPWAAAAPFAGAAPHLALLLAVALAELGAPAAAERVLGERPLPGGRTELALRPVLDGVTVRVELAADGAVVACQLEVAGFGCRLEADGLTAPSVRVRFHWPAEG
ncbi:MAG: hypothetical protein KF830_00295 [Planctomycetes bacterium]|nr:hypothetical protein [Planctomycetota bacterium]